MPIEILLVEDNPGDRRLIIEALRDAQVSNHLTMASDGVEALSMLTTPTHQEARHFNLILLDLNLPRKNGLELLVDIKADPRFKRIPVIVFTSSQAEADILKAYDLHANCYVKKPVDFNRFMDVVKSIENFWLTVVTLPEGN